MFKKYHIENLEETVLHSKDQCDGVIYVGAITASVINVKIGESFAGKLNHFVFIKNICASGHGPIRYAPFEETADEHG